MPCRILVHSSKAKSPGNRTWVKAFVFALTPKDVPCSIRSYAINIEKLSTTQNLATQLKGSYPALLINGLKERN